MGYDDSNAVRISFSFNGVDGFQFSSETTSGRDTRYFDWEKNGVPKTLSTFSDATQWTHFRVTREGNTIKTFISDGDTELQIGADVTNATLTNDLYVEFGLESKEYNTYRHNLTKFFVAVGSSSITTQFFSPDRGRVQEFPTHTIIVVDSDAISFIDEDNSKLWLRILIGGGLIADSNVKVAACNGVIYCTTPDGLIALDFPQDKIFRYKDSEIQVADEPISLRNAGITFRTFAATTGTMPSNNIHNVDCRQVGSEIYIAMVHDSGVTVRRTLASGVSNCYDGPVPGELVSISDKGALYWSGYDPSVGTGALSYYTNVTALAVAGTNTFSRAGYYGTNTTLAVLGEKITSFNVRTIEGTDLVAVGTTEGLTFIGLSPAVPASKAETHGVLSIDTNPFTDPVFQYDVGLYWVPFYDGFINNVSAYNTTSWATGVAYSLFLRSSDLQTGAHIIAGTKYGVQQEVDLTGVERLYFDLNFCPAGTGSDVWDFQVVVNGTVVKSYNSSEGPFIKYTDSADVLNFEGVSHVEFRIHFPTKISAGTSIDEYYLYITNLRVSVGEPNYRSLPAGNASIKEVLAIRSTLSQRKGLVQ